MNKGRGCIEPDRQPFLAGRETDPESDVRLAGSAVADCDNVFATGRVLGTGEFQDEGLVERRNRREVEAVEALDGREPRFLDPSQSAIASMFPPQHEP